MPNNRRRLAAAADHLDHVEPETNLRVLQLLHITDRRPRQDVPFVAVNGLRRSAVYLSRPCFNLDKNEHFAVAAHEIEFIAAADPHAPAVDAEPVALEP